MKIWCGILFCLAVIHGFPVDSDELLFSVEDFGRVNSESSESKGRTSSSTEDQAIRSSEMNDAAMAAEKMSTTNLPEIVTPVFVQTDLPPTTPMKNPVAVSKAARLNGVRTPSRAKAIENTETKAVKEEPTTTIRSRTRPGSKNTLRNNGPSLTSTTTSSTTDDLSDSSRTSKRKFDGLSEFLNKRRQERIRATTEVDPFVAILATAKLPPREEPVTESIKPSGRSFGSESTGSSSNRFNGRRNGGSRRTEATTTSTTTAAPETDRRTNRNRFPGFNRKNNGRTSSTTTEVTLVADQPQSEGTQKPKLVPKRPPVFRPVPNSILRRKDQTTSTPVPEVSEEVPAPAPAAEKLEETSVASAETASVPTVVIRRNNSRVKGNRL